MTTRRGVTLIEIVVVLAILGVMATVAGLTMHTASPAPPPNATDAHIAALRDSALTTGRPITTTIIIDNHASAVTAYPDGRVLSDANNVNPLTGRRRDSIP